LQASARSRGIHGRPGAERWPPRRKGDDKGDGLSKPDNDRVNNLSSEEYYAPVEPRTPTLEANAFTFVTGVLMSVALVAAVGTLIKAIARVLG
jgi:hypothetical protein